MIGYNGRTFPGGRLDPWQLLNRSASYHADYGGKAYKEIKRLARAKPPDPKARQMKKLIEQAERLRDKARKRPS